MSSRLSRNDRGAAIVEFALVAPLFLLMLLGMVAYGGYFWRAHALQQVANDAARAAIAGLTPAERRTLATASATLELPAYAGLAATAATVSVAETDDMIEVALEYDAADDAFFALGIVPLPDPVIRRTALVRLGGL